MMDDKYMYRNNMYMLINTKAYFDRSVCVSTLWAAVLLCEVERAAQAKCTL